MDDDSFMNFKNVGFRTNSDNLESFTHENTPFVSSSFIVQDEAYSNNDHESSVIRKPQLKISVPHLEGLTNGITIARVTRGRICDK